MIKIFLTCRNRFYMTKLCIEALYRNTEIPFELYIYDNLTDYMVKEHWGLFCMLYEKNLITKCTFNTGRSTYYAFSKAVAWNEFGFSHQLDPQKNKTDFILILDNDIIVEKEWDITILEILKYLKENENDQLLKNIHIVNQYFMSGLKEYYRINLEKYSIHIGTHTGSGFWALKPTFFDDIGFLDIKKFIGLNKKHDQEYWKLISNKTKGKPYVLSVDKMLYYNTGWIGIKSLCNKLNTDFFSDVKHEDEEEMLSKTSLDDIYKECVDFVEASKSKIDHSLLSKPYEQLKGYLK